MGKLKYLLGKAESKAQINNAMVPGFRKANWEGFFGKMNNLNWEYLLQGKHTYEMRDIFQSLLNKFTKQFIPMKKLGIIRKLNLSG